MLAFEIVDSINNFNFSSETPCNSTTTIFYVFLDLPHKKAVYNVLKYFSFLTIVLFFYIDAKVHCCSIFLCGTLFISYFDHNILGITVIPLKKLTF